VKISDFTYELPSELIAQHPSQKRTDARLMVVDRTSKTIEHRRFRDLTRFVSSTDLLVLNNTRVFPARLFAHREGRPEKLEVLLLRPVEGPVWEALIRPGKRARPGARLIFRRGQFEGEVLDSPPSAVRRLRFDHSGDFWSWVERLGATPLPPYIDRPATPEDRRRYQTVFAQAPGSVAAPTAGLHFTQGLLEHTPHCEVTLHVGYGTFKPVNAETVEEHRMDSEYYEINAETAERIMQQLKSQLRLIAVGTSTTRALEHVFSKHQRIVADCGWTDLFIYPGFDFKVLGGLITNFHLPGSTLLVLVSAFAGKGFIQECYREAIRKKYRFYSYGDAMLIL
jgi:S-adenosylmethionine:tRNA ribosyltransferase-isomerase